MGQAAFEFQKYASNATYTLNLLHSMQGVDYTNIIDGVSNSNVMLLFFEETVEHHRLTPGYGKHSVRYLGPVLWSKIDRKIRELKTLDEFKRKIRKADLAKYILCNNCINCTLCYS